MVVVNSGDHARAVRRRVPAAASPSWYPVACREASNARIAASRSLTYPRGRLDAGCPTRDHLRREDTLVSGALLEKSVCWAGGAAASTTMNDFVSKIASFQNFKQYEDLNWTGTFEEYLDMLRQNPRVARTAYERVYDMILSHGTEEYVDNKKKITRYHFFSDVQNDGKDAIFGLDIPLMRFVDVLKAAAMRYGTEKRIILLHGPVGSSKSTIARLLKKGLEHYSRTPEGALYTYEWRLPEA